MDRLLCNALKRQWLVCFFGALMLMLASALQAQDAAGTAISVRGYVTATAANGDIRALKRGDSVFSGDTIQTSKRSRIRMSFTDGSTSVLKSNAIFEISDYNFSGQEDGTERASFKLVQGALEAISGLIGKKNKNAFRLDTPLATIGLRGTEYVVEVFPPRTPGGRATIRVSVAGGSVVYSSPGAPPIAVSQGNSVTQTGGQQPQAQQGIITPLETITADGDDIDEILDNLYENETIDEADIEEARDAVGTEEETARESTTAEEPAADETPSAEETPTPAVDTPPNTPTPSSRPAEGTDLGDIISCDEGESAIVSSDSTIRCSTLL